MPDLTSLPFLASVFAFLFVVAIAHPARKLAIAVDLVDKPGGRKNHEKPVPPIGGLLIFPVFMIVGLMSGVALKEYWPLYIALIILLTTGALDDRFALHAWVKFMAHFAAAGLIVFFGNCQVAYLGNMFGFGTVWTGFMSYPFSIIAVVLLINAVNLMDGLDGLAGGKSCVMFVRMLVAALIAGYTKEAMVLSILIGAICGFLVFNMRNPWRRKANMFLGDSGSMCLGLMIAWFAIHLARGEHYPLEPIVVAWIIGLPIFDACAQFNRRVSEGRDPFSPDRGHFHHHLIDAGFTVGQATVFVMLVVLTMGVIGFGGYWLGVPQVILTILWVAALLSHMALSFRPDRYVKLLSQLRNKYHHQP